MFLKLTLMVNVEFDCTIKIPLIQVLMGYYEHSVVVGDKTPQYRTHIVTEVTIKVTEQLVKEDDIG